MPWFWEGKGPTAGADFSPMRKFQLKKSAFERLLMGGQEVDMKSWEVLERPDIVMVGFSAQAGKLPLAAGRLSGNRRHCFPRQISHV